MKIQVISDIHIEFHKDMGQAFWKDFPVVGDVLVIAGDLGTYIYITDNLVCAAQKFKHVVYVPGNHEYWGAPGYRTIKDAIDQAVARCPNIHWLFDSVAEIDGVRFLGNTMWFRGDGLAQMYENQWADFSRINRGRQWLYKANLNTRRFLEKELRKGDVIVTHHMPCDLSVNPRFRIGPNTWQNMFFVCDISELILAREPALALHGHTHDFNDYTIGSTRIVSNPYGYQGYEPVLNCDRSFCVDV